MKIYIGADHNGFDLKNKVVDYLRSRDITVEDEGDDHRDPDDDFPVFAQRVVTALQSSDDDEARGILICGSGQGMLIAANRFKGIRAGLGFSKEAARSIRNDEDSNVLALPAELLTDDHDWQDIIDTWISTPFANAPRFIRRNKQLDNIS